MRRAYVSAREDMQTHPHTQLTPQRCMGAPTKRAGCLLIVYTANIAVPPIPSSTAAEYVILFSF